MTGNRTGFDFFISYTGADRTWAEWIAFLLEEEGYKVVIQAWDFRPGSNFVMEMQRAAEKAERTILVLSPDYLKSQFTQPEWSAAFAKDPQGIDRRVVPIVVKPCRPDGLLKGLVHINLIGQDEVTAHQIVVDGVKTARAKPTARPAFPGGAPAGPHAAFPGAQCSLPGTQTPPYLPKLRRAASDADKRRFMKEAFDTIATYFEGALAAFAQTDPAIETDFDRRSAIEFTAEIFTGGKSVAACRIWRGTDFGSDGICYFEGRTGLGSCSAYNEILGAADDAGELRLASIMGGIGLGDLTKRFDLKKLSSDEGGEYLWRRLVMRLER
ncbi:MAG: hypothetical protein JWP35_1609 [Caulobacter sp.]|nr:hypothetical protein [Caulobacter sp.]